MRAPILASMILIWPGLLSVVALPSISREESIGDDLNKSVNKENQLPKLSNYSAENQNTLHEKQNSLEVDLNRRTLAITNRCRKGVLTRWPEARVPYAYLNYFTPHRKFEIRSAMKHIEEYSCVNFQPAKISENNNDRIEFKNVSRGCSSYVGRYGGRQIIKLSRGCSYGTVIHELCHAIGLYHEQQRPDRDEYVVIDYYDKDTVSNRIKPADEAETFLQPYDFDSIMHYRAVGNILNTRKEKNRWRVGQRKGLSFGDIKTINLMYKCKGTETWKNGCSRKECGPQGFVGKDCNCWCPGRSVSDPVNIERSGKKCEARATTTTTITPATTTMPDTTTTTTTTMPDTTATITQDTTTTATPDTTTITTPATTTLRTPATTTTTTTGQSSPFNC